MSPRIMRLKRIRHKVMRTDVCVLGSQLHMILLGPSSSSSRRFSEDHYGKLQEVPSIILTTSDGAGDSVLMDASQLRDKSHFKSTQLPESIQEEVEEKYATSATNSFHAGRSNQKSKEVKITVEELEYLRNIVRVTTKL